MRASSASRFACLLNWNVGLCVASEECQHRITSWPARQSRPNAPEDGLVQAADIFGTIGSTRVVALCLVKSKLGVGDTVWCGEVSMRKCKISELYHLPRRAWDSLCATSPVCSPSLPSVLLAVSSVSRAVRMALRVVASDSCLVKRICCLMASLCEREYCRSVSYALRRAARHAKAQ